MRHAEPGEVFVSSACDGWLPLEAERRLTRRCCELLLAHGFTVNLLTKSVLVLRDFDVLTQGTPKSRVGVTVTTLDEDLRALWEPGASSVAERFRVIEEARRAGLQTAIMFGPLCPSCPTARSRSSRSWSGPGDLGVDVVWVDALNARPRVWPAVAQLFRERFPDLHAGYQRLLFDRTARAAYLTDLGRRVAQAAKRLSLSDRVRSCV